MTTQVDRQKKFHNFSKQKSYDVSENPQVTILNKDSVIFENNKLLKQIAGEIQIIKDQIVD